MSKKLRFRARGEALVQNLERLEAGIKSFIGRKFVQVGPEQWGFDPTGDEEVAYRAEYVKACKDGDLYPADEATASACSVSFDPYFGGPKPTEKTSAKAEKG
jgi:hypothetical protein